MPALTPNIILIVEPKKELAVPYDFLPQVSQVIHLTSIQRATQYLHDQLPDLVVISSSYSPSQIFQLLEMTKARSAAQRRLIPILFNVDLSHQINFIPGTHWGQRLGIMNSLSSQQEVELVIKRICRQL